MHIHVLSYEGFEITIISPHDTVDWNEIINDFIGEVATSG